MSAGRRTALRLATGAALIAAVLLVVVSASLALALAPAPAWADSPHLAIVSGSTCASCHAVHQATTSAGLFKGIGASSGEQSVCYSCHDGTGASTNIKTGPDSFGLTSGHVLEGLVDTSIPADLTNGCSSCHTAHGDYATRTGLPARTVNSVAISSTGNAWCLACHNDANDWYAKKGTYPSLSSPTRNATGFPVAGTFAGATVYADQTKNAHVLIPATAGAKSRQAGDCLYCHAAHGSTAPYDALVANVSPSTSQTVTADRTTGAYAALCFTCHSGGSWETSGAPNIARYATHDATDTGIGAGGGHRIKSSGGTLPTNAPLPCYDCHNPHGSSRGNKRLISDALGASLDTSAGPTAVRQFCFTCHTSSDGFGWESATATYTAPAGTALVEGLRRDGGAPGSGPDFGQNWLRLRTSAGHAKADSTSCYDCHGSDYSKASGNNVHDPLAYDAAAHAAPTVTCTAAGCHTGAGSLVALHSNATTTVAGVTRTGCQVCHADGTPASGACSACHDVNAPHADETARHTANIGSLTSIEYHNGTLAINETCVSCHGSTNLITLHGGDCSVCHSSPRNTFTTWNKGCQQGGCHTTVHASASSGHQSQPDCFQCHYEDTYVLACSECHATAPDTTPPVTTHSPSGPQIVGSAPITLSASDDSGRLGVKSTFYRLDGGPVTAGTQALLVAPVSGSAAHVLDYWSTDWSQNVETTHTVSFTVSADVLPPVTTSDVKATYNGPAVVSFTVTDNATLPGGITTYSSVDGATAVAGTTITVPQPSSGTAPHTLRYWSVDRVGNPETPTTVSFTITNDAVAPTTTTNIPHYWSPIGLQILDFHITDPAPSSGIADLAIGVTNGSVWSKWGVGGFNNLYWRASMNMYLQGPQTLTYWATDNAGNQESQNSTTVVVDWSAPITTTNAVPDYVGPATIGFSATDTYSPIAGTKYALSYPGYPNTALSGSSFTVPPPATGRYSGYAYYYSGDAAGNWESSTAHVAYFNVWAVGTPTLTYQPGANGTVTGKLFQPVLSGGSGTAVTAVPNGGYHFVNWSDGSTANSRTDANVTFSKVLTANFAVGP